MGGAPSLSPSTAGAAAPAPAAGRASALPRQEPWATPPRPPPPRPPRPRVVVVRSALRTTRSEPLARSPTQRVAIYIDVDTARTPTVGTVRVRAGSAVARVVCEAGRG